MAKHFPIRYFFENSLRDSRCLSASGSSANLRISFSVLYSTFGPFLSYILIQIVLLILHPIVGVFLCILHLPVCRISFSYFGISCFVCIVWPCLLSLLSFTNFFFIYLFKLHCQTRLLFSFDLFVSAYPQVFFLPCTLACCYNFLTCPLSLISDPDFVFIVLFPLRNTDFITD